MKRLKPEKKRLIVGIIAVVLIAALFFSAVAPFLYVFGAELNESDITVEASAGFDGNIKVGNGGLREDIGSDAVLTEFKIKLKNNSNSDFKGSISIPLWIYNAGSEKLKTEAELKAGEEKEFSLKRQLGAVNDCFYVDIEDEKGNRLISEKFPLKCSSYNSPWVGFLSDTPEMLYYLKTGFLSDQSYFFNFDRKNFPDDVYVLNSFNLIVINDFDIEFLNQAQRAVLKEWINEGGILLCGEDLGSVSENEFGYLKEDIDAKTKLLKYDAALSGKESDELDMLTVYNSGKGKIYFNNRDISYASESFVISCEISDIYNDIIENIENTDDFLSSLSYYNDRMPVFSDLLLIIILIVVLIYFIFIGFVLFFILKKRDKAKAAFFIIPAASVALTVLIYVCSLSTVYKKPIINTITFFGQKNGENLYANAVAEVMAASPDKGDIKISVPKENKIIRLENDYDYGSYDYNKTNSENNPEESVLRELSFGDENILTYFDMAKWDSISFGISADSINIGGIVMDLNIYDNEIKGSITNNTEYDLYDVIIGGENKYFLINEFNKGETVNIGGGDYKFSLEDMPTDYNSVSFDRLLTDGRRDKEIDEKRLYELERRQDIANGILMQNTENGIEFEIIGFSSDKIFNDEFYINGKSPEINNTNVFYACRSFDVSDFIQGAIPKGFIKPELENGSGAFDDGEWLEFYDIGSALTISYTVPEAVDADGFTLYCNENEYKAEIYNCSKNIWEPVKESYGSEFNDYIIGNKITVKLTSIGESYVSAPQIEIKLRG